MKIVFVSNIMNHHQILLCNDMLQLCDELYFIETQPEYQQGYQKHIDAPFIIQYPQNENKVNQLILDADVVIFGSCPNSLIKIRMAENKLSFLYSERFFKKGVWRRFIPRTYKAVYNRIIRYKNENMYVLCASAYLPYDISLLGFPRHKCFKWGYFPETKNYSDISTLISTKKNNSLLWVGRFIDWKHPEIAVLTAKYLKEQGVDFTLNIIGDGDEKENLNHLIKKYNLENNVTLLGSKSPSEVREYMEKSEILLFTSDRKEGWGAVLNEAMNSTCAVVANSEIGSAPMLLCDGKNGLLYPDGNLAALFSKVKMLLSDAEKRRALGFAAYETIQSEWNAGNAAQKFVKLCNSLLKSQNTPFENGVCARAEVLCDGWYK